MAEQTTKIIGVDFSGAVTRNTTWVAKGELKGRILTIKTCFKPASKQEEAHLKVKEILTRLPPGAVAAMDFPFSVPKSFLEHWSALDEQISSARTMPDLWRRAGELKKSNKKLRRWCKEFVNKRKKDEIFPTEPKRVGDFYSPNSFSPLHRVRPDMVAMTFRGMEILQKVWDNSQCQVPPINFPERTGSQVIEVMPSAILSAMGLTNSGYKGKGKECKKFREVIWDNLSCKSGIKLNDPNDCRNKAIYDSGGDCLDAVVAAIAAALWHIDQEIFHGPPMQCSSRWDDVILKEGWLYTPCPSKLPVCIDE